MPGNEVMPLQHLADTYFSCLYRLVDLASAEQREAAFRQAWGRDEIRPVSVIAYFRFDAGELP